MSMPNAAISLSLPQAGRLGTVLVGLAFLVLAGPAPADVFKCKTREGKTVISSEPCQEGSRTEAVRPSERISPEQKLEAEQQLARERERLAEREKLRAGEEQREQDSRRRLAEEESARQTRCMDNAQREPDPALRANLIAACQGVAPNPTVVHQPVYIPVVPARRPTSPPCIGSDCGRPTPPPRDKPATVAPANTDCQKTGTCSSARIGPGNR